MGLGGKTLAGKTFGGREPIGVAVVGAGAWGRNHVRVVQQHPGTRLVAVCDRDGKSLKSLSLSQNADGQGVFLSTELDTLLIRDDVHAVVVSTTTPSHARIARACIDAGKHVLVEKPLSLRHGDAEDLVLRARMAGVRLMTGHLLLFHPVVQRLRSMIAKGDLGEVVGLSSARLNLGVVRGQENAWWSLAPHDVALANYLLGEVPVEVMALGDRLLQRGTERRVDAEQDSVHPFQDGREDTVFASLGYPSGVRMHVHVSWLCPTKVRRFSVIGTQGVAVFNDVSPDRKLVMLGVGSRDLSPKGRDVAVEGVEEEVVCSGQGMEEPLVAQLTAFVSAIEEGKIPCSGAEFGAEVVRVLEAGAQSLRDGGLPVWMPEQPTRAVAANDNMSDAFVPL